MSDPLIDPFAQPTDWSEGDSLTSEPQVPLASDDAPQVDDSLRCPVCGRVFKRKNDCTNHLKTHSRPPKPTKDKAPPSVTINLGGDKKTKDPELDAVQERARQLANLVAMLVLLTGQSEDANDIMQGSEPWAKAVRDLAVYEKWLRNLAAGGETSGRAIAWATFVAATIGMLMPILLRHEVLPKKIAEGFETAMKLQEAMASGPPQTARTSV